MNYPFGYNVSLHGSWSNMSWNATAIYFAR
ncbi:hypothetical protein SAMN04488540_102138 [Ferrimonas sediminum]|uniref:Uncharacterized protein n=1 Tax=Ferrimonas sediminum TaxID=718193 RepID=A0A1G8LQL7_9GAMM|nr:hypothetical protein SAMN04488540_102138 [Ferrimonas sediminum]